MAASGSSARAAAATLNTQELDEVIASLRERAPVWARTSIAERVRLLQEHLERFLPLAEEWAREATRQRGVDPDANPGVVGEEIMACTGVATRVITCYLNTLRPAAEAEEAGQPITVAPVPFAPKRVGGGTQLAVQVLPVGFKEKQLWNGYTGELWLEPGVEEVVQAPLYTQKTAEERAAIHGVSLVLGAGNVNSITAADALHKLLVENKVVLVKMNPVNEYSMPYLEDVFEPFLEEGFIKFVRGGADVGSYLCQHEGIDDIHITGSGATHDIIVWGATEAERTRNKQANTPRLHKPITSELGGVSPIIVVPGEWSDKELRYQARNVAGLVTHNLSFNCIAGKVLVLDRDWPQREQFVDAVRKVFAETRTRPAYYPGAKQRWEAFRGKYPDSSAIDAEPLPGTNPENHLPWLLIDGLPAEEGEYAFCHEAFCPVLAITTLETHGDAAQFVPAAVDFVNTKVDGTLACVIIVDPRTQNANKEVMDAANRDLRYGAIVYNAFAGVAFGLGSLSWGGFPGHTLDNIGSGIGQVHNTYMVQHVQKSVVYAPFRMLLGISQPWFPDHKTTKQMGLALARFTASPSLVGLFKALFHALRG